MRFNKRLWVVAFYDEFPSWPCPSCNEGSLKRNVNKDVLAETALSRKTRAENLGDWEPDWADERAMSMLSCNRCDDPIMLISSVNQIALDDEHYGAHLGPGFKPVYFLPAPPLIDVPLEAAGEVRDALHRAFAYYWSDPSSSGNCIRTSVEMMLDQLKIPRAFNDTKKHKRVRLPLHARLQLFAARWPALADTLMAIKWLGNAGTHDVLSHEDVLDAFELLDHVLDEVYRSRSKRIAQTVKAINRNQGPRKKKKV